MVDGQEQGAGRRHFEALQRDVGEKAPSLISGSSCFLIESEIKLPLVIITFSSKDHPI